MLIAIFSFPLRGVSAMWIEFVDDSWVSPHCRGRKDDFALSKGKY